MICPQISSKNKKHDLWCDKAQYHTINFFVVKGLDK